MQEGSLFSTFFVVVIVCRFFDDGHSDWCEVIPHFSFDYHFFNNGWYCVFFHVYIGLLWQNVSLGFLNIFVDFIVNLIYNFCSLKTFTRLFSSYFLAIHANKILKVAVSIFFFPFNLIYSFWFLLPPISGSVHLTFCHTTSSWIWSLGVQSLIFSLLDLFTQNMMWMML